MSRALLNKTLIQLFADEWHCIPSLVVIWPKANLRPDSLEIPEMGTWVLISGAELHEQNMQTLTVACKWIGFILKEKKVQSSQHRHSVSSVQLLSCVWLFVTPMDCSMPGFPVHHQLLELAQTRVHQVSDAIQPYCSLLSSFPPAFNLSQHQGLSNESVLHMRWPKYWSFSFSISLSNEHPTLISF